MDAHEIEKQGKPIARDPARPFCFPATEAAHRHLRQNGSLLIRSAPFAKQVGALRETSRALLLGLPVPAGMARARYRLAAASRRWGGIGSSQKMSNRAQGKISLIHISMRIQNSYRAFELS